MSRHTTFCTRLASILHDNRSDRWVSRKRTGKLDFKRLSRVAVSDKLFKKREERKGKNYNVSILVDASGSMAGNKIRNAVTSMQNLARAAGQVGLNLEIAAFNSGDFILREFSTQKPTQKELEDMENDLLVLATGGTYGDRDKCTLPWRYRFVRTPSGIRVHLAMSDKDAIAYFNTAGVFPVKVMEAGNAREYNFDGLAIHNAVNRLLELKNGGNNILIVLSDGEPSYVDFLCPGRLDDKKVSDFTIEHEVTRAHKRGVVVLSIGINTETVTSYYPKKNCRVIKNSDELYPAIISLISNNVVRG